MIVCMSGAVSYRSKCGAVEWPPVISHWGNERENGNPAMWAILAHIPIKHGDSGGPLWERGTGMAVGTLMGGGELTPSWWSPLLPLPDRPAAPGSLAALGVEGEPLHIVKWKP